MRALSAADQANDLVRHLGDQVGIPSLALDAQGRCQLLVGRRWSLSLVLDAVHDTLYLICPIASPEQLGDIAPAAWVAMLQAQHLGGRSPGAGMSVDPQGRVCVQQALHLPSALPGQLVGAVEATLGRAVHWSQLLAQVPSGAVSAAALAPPARMHHTRI